MREHDQRIIHSSEESNWRTPPALYNLLVKEFGWMVDAAADKQSALSGTWFGPGSEKATLDALAIENWRDWGEGRYFLNPPYSRKLKMPVAPWAEKCWTESQDGCVIVGLFPFAPQTDWYRQAVYGHQLLDDGTVQWLGHAATEERRITHRVSFLRPDGSPASNAGVNSVVIIWRPNYGIVGPWQPLTRYWSYR